MHCCTRERLFTFWQARVWKVLVAKESSSEESSWHKKFSLCMRTLEVIESHASPIYTDNLEWNIRGVLGSFILEVFQIGFFEDPVLKWNWVLLKVGRARAKARVRVGTGV